MAIDAREDFRGQMALSSNIGGNIGAALGYRERQKKKQFTEQQIVKIISGDLTVDQQIEALSRVPNATDHWVAKTMMNKKINQQFAKPDLRQGGDGRTYRIGQDGRASVVEGIPGKEADKTPSRFFTGKDGNMYSLNADGASVSMLSGFGEKDAADEKPNLTQVGGKLYKVSKDGSTMQEVQGNPEKESSTRRTIVKGGDGKTYIIDENGTGTLVEEIPGTEAKDSESSKPATSTKVWTMLQAGASEAQIDKYLTDNDPEYAASKKGLEGGGVSEEGQYWLSKSLKTDFNASIKQEGTIQRKDYPGLTNDNVYGEEAYKSVLKDLTKKGKSHKIPPEQVEEALNEIWDKKYKAEKKQKFQKYADRSTFKKKKVEGDEQEFQEWYAGWAEKTGINPNPDDPKHKYDYRAAFRAGVEPKISDQDGKYHWNSKFKDDDHPNLIVEGVNTKTGKSVINEEMKVETRGQIFNEIRKALPDIDIVAKFKGDNDTYTRLIDAILSGNITLEEALNMIKEAK